MGTVINDSFKVNDLSFDGYFFGGSLVVMVSKHYLIDCVNKHILVRANYLIITCTIIT